MPAKKLLDYLLYLMRPRAFPDYIPTGLACLCAFVSCLPTCLPVYLPMYFCILRVDVASCLIVLQVEVPAVFTLWLRLLIVIVFT